MPQVLAIPTPRPGTAVDDVVDSIADPVELLDIADAISVPSGAGLFPALVARLAKSLDADCAWIGEIVAGTEPRLRTLAVWANGRSASNFEYDLVNTPGETALTKSGICFFSAGVREWFNTDPILRTCEANAYAAIPLLDSANELIGLAAVVSRTCFRNNRLVGSYLRILGSRAAAELERLKTVEALHASEARLGIILENACDACLLLACDGTLLAANRAAEGLTGYSREQIVGRNLLVAGILSEEDLRGAAARLAARAEGLPPSVEAFTIVRSDRTRRRVDADSQLTSLDGVPVMLLGVRRTVDEDRECRLARMRELQSAAFALATHEAIAGGDLNRIAAIVTETVCRIARAGSVSVWLFAADGDRIECLDRFDSAMDGHAPEKAMRGPAFRDHRGALESARIVENGRGPSAWFDTGIRIRGKIAGFLRIEPAAGSGFGQTPEETQFITAVSDLLAQALVNADRAQAEAALRRSEARLNRTQRIAALGSWERDLATNRLEWSDEALRIYGIGRDEFVPTREFFIDRVHPADRARLDAGLNELLLTGEPGQITFRIIRPDGSVRHLRELAELEMNAAGEPVRLIGSVQDITELRELEEHFHTAQRIESLGRLASGVAQSFNNLLTVVKGYSSLIMRTPSNQSVVKKGMETILKAGEEASVVIEQLLAFSQRHTTETAVLEINTIVREFDRMLRPMFGAGIDVVSQLEPEAGHIEASPAQVNQILLNLAINARDAMPKGGRLVMQTANIGNGADSPGGGNEPGPGDWVMLSVSDTGEGMDEITRSQIFEPFFTTKKASGATGLGMSTVYAIVQRCGGKLQIDSRPGVGSTVRVFLPRVSGEHIPPVQDFFAEEALRGTETILLVEDQPEVRTLVATVLESLGYRILSAPNAESGARLNLEYRARIDLLLTDVVMPGMRGDEFAERIRASRPAIRILFMSGYTSNTALQRNDPPRGMAFIRKPFDPFALAAKIRELLGSTAPAATLLVADADEGVRGMLRRVLATAGHNVVDAASLTEALECLDGGNVDLMITDGSGAGLFEQETTWTAFERKFPELPVIRLGNGTGPDAAFSGAHVMLRKPIQPDTLLSAIRRILLAKSSSIQILFNMDAKDS